jgi:multidrug resistance efflux pump
MILAMMVGYIVILHLIFNVFKLVKASMRNKIYVAALGCFLIYCVLLFINYYQPMSTDLRVFRFVVPLRTRLEGVVVEVPVQPNVPLQKGDVIFRIDPRTFEAEVARLEAALIEAKQAAKMLPADLTSAQASVAKAEARLVEAKQQEESLKIGLESAAAEVAKAKADLELAEANLTRDVAVAKKSPGSITPQELDVRQAMFKTATAALDGALAQEKNA